MRAFLIGGESVLHEKKKGRFLRFLRLGLMVLLLLIAAVITYLVVILVHPQREEGTLTASPAPFSTPGSGYVLESADQVPELLGAFPGPVLLAADSSAPGFKCIVMAPNSDRTAGFRTGTRAASPSSMSWTVCAARSSPSRRAVTPRSMTAAPSISFPGTA